MDHLDGVVLGTEKPEVVSVRILGPLPEIPYVQIRGRGSSRDPGRFLCNAYEMLRLLGYASPREKVTRLDTLGPG